MSVYVCISLQGEHQCYLTAKRVTRSTEEEDYKHQLDKNLLTVYSKTTLAVFRRHWMISDTDTEEDEQGSRGMQSS